MKLISMTDYVISKKVDKNAVKEYSFFEIQNKIMTFYDLTVNYANFLKQPLELWMFVPCDEDGNVLIEPIYTITNYGILEDGLLRFQEDKRKYQQAKERILFEDEIALDAVQHHISQCRTIEYLANFNSLTLTQSAIEKFN